MVEEAPLPEWSRTVSQSQRFRQALFEQTHERAEILSRHKPSEEMDMIRHDDISPDSPALLTILLSIGSKSLVDIMVCKDLLALTGVESDEVKRLIQNSENSM